MEELRRGVKHALESEEKLVQRVMESGELPEDWRDTRKEISRARREARDGIGELMAKSIEEEKSLGMEASLWGDCALPSLVLDKRLLGVARRTSPDKTAIVTVDAVGELMSLGDFYRDLCVKVRECIRDDVVRDLLEGEEVGARGNANVLLVRLLSRRIDLCRHATAIGADAEDMWALVDEARRVHCREGSALAAASAALAGEAEVRRLADAQWSGSSGRGRDGRREEKEEGEEAQTEAGHVLVFGAALGQAAGLALDAKCRAESVGGECRRADQVLMRTVMGPLEAAVQALRGVKVVQRLAGVSVSQLRPAAGGGWKRWALRLWWEMRAYRGAVGLSQGVDVDSAPREGSELARDLRRLLRTYAIPKDAIRKALQAWCSTLPERDEQTRAAFLVVVAAIVATAARHAADLCDECLGVLHAADEAFGEVEEESSEDRAAKVIESVLSSPEPIKPARAPTGAGGGRKKERYQLPPCDAAIIPSFAGVQDYGSGSILFMLNREISETLASILPTLRSLLTDIFAPVELASELQAAVERARHLLLSAVARLANRLSDERILRVLRGAFVPDPTDSDISSNPPPTDPTESDLHHQKTALRPEDIQGLGHPMLHVPKSITATISEPQQLFELRRQDLLDIAETFTTQSLLTKDNHLYRTHSHPHKEPKPKRRRN